MKENSNKKYFYILTLIMMASAFLPIVFANLPPLLRSHHVYNIIWFFSLIIFSPKVFQNKLFLLVLLYGGLMIFVFFNTLWVNIGEWNKKQFLNEFYEIAVGVSVITYYRVEKDFYRLAKLARWTLFFVFITSVMSIITAFIEPTYARSLTGLSAINLQSDVDYYLSFKKLGGGTYGFAASLVCLFPALIYYVKNISISNIKMRYLIILLLSMFSALLGMQIFANILLATILILISFIFQGNNKNNIIVATVVLIIIFLIPIDTFVSLLSILGSLFSTQSAVYSKINDIITFIIYEDSINTGISVRAARYPLLLDSFVANPFVGHFLSGRTNDISYGAHLHWMYKLAVYGLFGALPFFYILYKFIKNSLNYFNKEHTFYFLLAVFSIIILGFMKTLAGREMWYMFFIIVPGLYYSQYLKNGNSNSN